MPEFPCPNPIKVSVRVRSGTVEIVAEDRDTASVSVEPFGDGQESHEAAGNTRIDLNGDELIVDAPDASGWIFRRSARVRVAIRVPSDSTLALTVTSADATCLGRLAEAVVKASSGDVSIEEVTGDLSVEQTSGDCSIRRVGGNASVASSSGDVRIGSVGGETIVTAASGDVVIDEAAGSVSAKTASGDIRLRAIRSGTANLNSTSGDVGVGVPAGTLVWLDLSTTSGKTTSDLTVTDSSPGEGGAQLTLQVRTTSGDIEVRRVSQPANA
jgi:DUF4097 and DUF4098 domain-containing protein YvlB